MDNSALEKLRCISAGVANEHFLLPIKMLQLGLFEKYQQISVILITGFLMALITTFIASGWPQHFPFPYHSNKELINIANGNKSWQIPERSKTVYQRRSLAKTACIVNY